MRIVLLLLAASLSFAAELPVEDFTLVDGRKLSGVYDSETQTLTLQGGVASLKIAADQIVDRAPAKVIEAPKAEATATTTEPVQRPARATGKVSGNPFDTPAVKAAEAQYLAAKKAYMQAAVDAWYNANIKPVKVPDVGPNPRESEREARVISVRLNNRINYTNINFKGWLAPDRLGNDDSIKGMHQAMNEARGELELAAKSGIVP